MLTTTELAKKTGLSVKTLGRWVDQGILTKPTVGTAPSGRGKVGFWPDETLPFVQNILELRRSGHSLNDAVNRASLERYENLRAKFENEAKDLVYGDKIARTSSGEEVDLVAMLHLSISSHLRESILSDSAKSALWAELLRANHLSAAIHQIQEGYNVLLAFDGKRVAIRPDFVFHEVGNDLTDATAPFVTIPINPLYDESLRRIGLTKLIQQPKTYAAPKVWSVQPNGEVREYQYFQRGTFGYQFVGSEKGTVIGVVPAAQPEKKASSPRKRKT
jgi:DNA-binding transcriptional MerR regulator